MKARTAVALAAIAGALGTAGCGNAKESAAGSPGAPGGAATQRRFLFVLQAGGAEAAAAPGGRRARLHLDGVDPLLLAFTDRPLRVAETRPTAELADRWSEYGFGDDPPNAALVVAGKAIEAPVALELSAPRYDPAAHTLDFEVASLAGDPTGVLRRALAASEAGAGAISLFIDATQGAPPTAPSRAQRLSEMVDAIALSMGLTFDPEQRSLLATDVGDLLLVLQAPTATGDLALAEANVSLFVDDLEEVLGVTLSADQRRLLTRDLLHLAGLDA